MFSVYPFPLWWLREYTLCLIIIIKPEVWTIIHCLGLGHETMVCAVCLFIFLWIREMARLLRGTFVSWWYLPRIWPSLTDMQHYYDARYPTDDWHLAYMFSLVYFSVDVCLVGVYPHSVSTRRDPCVRVCAPLTAGFLPHEKTKIELGVTRLSTWAKWGGIWTDAWVCRHYWVVIWVAGYCNSPLYCTVYGVCHRQDTLWP